MFPSTDASLPQNDDFAIESIDVFAIPPRWVFVRVKTSGGAVGWGEATLEGHGLAVMGAVKDLEERLVGRDARAIEDAFQIMYRGGFYRGGPVLSSAASGIEQALWDLKGRALGVPVYELLGGACRTNVRVYAWTGGDRPGIDEESIAALVEDGITAIKMNATPELSGLGSVQEERALTDRIGQLRSIYGDSLDIAVDFHGRVRLPVAHRLVDALEEFKLLFIEEPVSPSDIKELAQVRRRTKTPIAAGERWYLRWGFRDALEQGAVDVIQPDLSHAGGILECRKISAMAEAYDVFVAPHSPLGPLALAACLQLDSCTPNVAIQEYGLGIHYNQEADILDYVMDTTPLRQNKGFLAVPTGPGLGIEIDEAAVEAAAKNSGEHWRTPQWRLPDGTVAEW